VLEGGDGNDIYILRNASTKLTELAGAGSADHVRSYVSFTLGDNFENLTLMGKSNLNVMTFFTVVRA
jgi:hypothetical protein